MRKALARPYVTVSMQQGHHFQTNWGWIARNYIIGVKYVDVFTGHKDWAHLRNFTDEGVRDDWMD